MTLYTIVINFCVCWTLFGLFAFNVLCTAHLSSGWLLAFGFFPWLVCKSCLSRRDMNPLSSALHKTFWNDPQVSYRMDGLGCDLLDKVCCSSLHQLDFLSLELFRYSSSSREDTYICARMWRKTV